MWRNVTLDAKPLAYLGNWSVPDEGILAFDYVSLLPVDAGRVEGLGLAVMEDSVCYRLKRELTQRCNAGAGRDTLQWFYLSLCELKLQITCQQALFMASTLPPLEQSASLHLSLSEDPQNEADDNGCSTEPPSRPHTTSSSSSSRAALVSRVDILHVCHRCPPTATALPLMLIQFNHTNSFLADVENLWKLMMEDPQWPLEARKIVCNR
jgi:hypothetical protein